MQGEERERRRGGSDVGCGGVRHFYGLTWREAVSRDRDH